MRVACADGNLLAITATTGSGDGAACDVVCVVNRASPTATASAPAPPAVNGFSFAVQCLWIILARRHKCLPIQIKTTKTIITA